MKKLLAFCGVVFFGLVSCFAQQELLDKAEASQEADNYQISLDLLAEVDTTKLSVPQKARFYYLQASNYKFRREDSEAYPLLLKAKKLYTTIDSLEKVATINLELFQVVKNIGSDQLHYKEYINEYLDYHLSQNKPKNLRKAYIRIAVNFARKSTVDSSFKYFRKALKLIKIDKDTLAEAQMLNNFGVLYNEFTPYKDSALFYFDRSRKFYKKPTDLESSYLNTASAYKKLGKYDEAIFNYIKADSLLNLVKEYQISDKQFLYDLIAKTYELANKPTKALEYYKLTQAYQDSLNLEDQEKAIYDIQTKYEVQKKENENLRLKQYRTWLFSGVILLVLLLVASYLVYRNQMAKKQLQIKQSALEKNQLEKQLKDQELAGLDAMLEGQEKERQQIANDLHDNLGGLLATLKLHFQNLKIKTGRLRDEQDELFKTTDSLLNETYQQVRNYAHQRNAGLKTSEGLVPSIKNYAAKVSVGNSLVIHIEDHDMERRLETSLEITIFRILQELITNVIKHAEASEIIVHLTAFDDHINIMVEDDGKGFDTSKLKEKNGMGLGSIIKRIEHIGGKVEIDSQPDGGTTVILDIPVS
ncbi:tetratricopeptide repeat-containing sensor histidine kinase [Zunongwangia sp. HRR-M8]|uniref:tetratricopeptide repeat-containing sensor histidine kinase n=1 Tax=Zunongwangia sp. HRR-M8 TaxID=3015170 RepID=UPI0022DDC024|nr:ATP-binding protein [Zunongwangia sp. HRR-M8]WBL22142.1 ATP-binding protein [Zunongwangia sp. HRR-M8]